MGKKKLKLGSLYKVKWRDHCKSLNKPPQEMADEDDFCMVSYGVYTAYNKKYYVFTQTHEDGNVTYNSDNIKIIKKEIVEVKKI